MAFVAALALFLAAWNNLANLHPGFARWYAVVNVAVTLALLAVGRAIGVSWTAVGLAADRLEEGLLGGGAVAAAVALAYGLALAVPRLRPLLHDARVAGLAPRTVAFGALVRIPLGTVVLEEVAFRGLLLAAWTQVQPVPAAVLGSSVVFGVWHVVPTLALLDANGVRGGRRRALATALAVLATAAAGVGLCALRLVTGSLLAPVLVHLATNSLGLVAAARVTPRP